MILGLYCAVVSVREGHSAIPVTKAKGIHLFSFRTQKLSPSALMVLGWTRPGRVGRRRLQIRKRGSNTSLFFCVRREGNFAGLSSIFSAKSNRRKKSRRTSSTRYFFFYYLDEKSICLLSAKFPYRRTFWEMFY